jgi:tetratricopeptide (TPR) repeat protein
MRLLAKCYENIGENGGDWAIKACNEAPNTREPWVELAEIYMKRELWEFAYDAIKQALKVTNKEEVYTMDPTVWGAKPHDICALASYYLKNKPEALEHGKLALEFDPDNTRLRQNLTFYLDESHEQRP